MHGSLELVYVLVFKTVIQTICRHLSCIHLPLETKPSFALARGHMVTTCPRSWRLVVGHALIVLQFARLCGCARVLGFSTNLECVLG